MVTIESPIVRPAATDAGALAEAFIAHAPPLQIGHCLRRSEALLKSNRWPIIGTTFLLLLLTAVPVLGTLLAGSLVGGLYVYLLRQLRGQPAELRHAFQTFNELLIPLFLATVIMALLTAAGFICLIIPGLYLSVAYIFTYPLIVDRQLGFWTALEVSRRVVTTQWSRVFLLVISYLAVCAAGLLAAGIGFIFTLPLGVAMIVCAYDDLFNSAGAPRPAGVPGAVLPYPMAAPAITPASATTEQAEARTQVEIYRRARRRRSGAVALAIGAAFFLTASVALSIRTATGAVLTDLPAAPGFIIAIEFVIAGIFGFLSYRQFVRSRRGMSELEARAGLHGSLYRCVCGQPMQRYFWLHIFLSIVLIPWGLLSLLFPLKRCRNCSRPYDPMVMEPGGRAAKN